MCPQRGQAKVTRGHMETPRTGPAPEADDPESRLPVCGWRGGHVLGHRRRPDVAPGRGPHARHPVGSRRLGAELLDPAVGRRSLAPVPRRRPRRVPRVLQREHLLPRAADARLLRASDRAGAADPSGLRPHRQHRPVVQPAVSVDLRPLGPRDVPARARADRERARGVRGRPALRVRAVPHWPVLAPAGDVVAVDAVRAVRLQALLPHAPRLAARRRRAGAGGAELVVRVLPAVLRAVRGRLRDLRDRRPRAVERRAGVGVAWRGGRGRVGRDAAAAASVPGTAEARLRAAAVRRGDALFGRRLQLPHRPRAAVVLGRHHARLPEVRGRSVSRRWCPCCWRVVGLAAHAA